MQIFSGLSLIEFDASQVDVVAHFLVGDPREVLALRRARTPVPEAHNRPLERRLCAEVEMAHDVEVAVFVYCRLNA